MTITKQKKDTALTIILEGRLDTTTAPELEKEVKEGLDGITSLILDLKLLAYLSSAGLRVVLGAQKKMNKQGTMVIRHANETIMGVFDATGFSDILTVERE